MRDLGKIHEENGWAVFLPAISAFYAHTLSKAKHNQGFLSQGRVPGGFENDIEGMNFLDQNLGYFCYNNFLYSAGHAKLDIATSDVKDEMVQVRDRNKTTVVGDSGGFQIGKGVIKFDWENFFEVKGDPNYVGKADGVRMKILRWLEHTAEWSMTLDVPTWACDINNREKTGLTSFDDCLKATLHNNEFFLKHRTPGATKFLNVLQGGDFLEAQTWYEAVKHYPFEGWAFGGNNMRDMGMALKRLIILRDEGLLQDRDWIHFLGTSKLDWACYLTAIQRQLRKHINPKLTISFDCASPFIAVANGLTYTSYFHTPDKWTYSMDSCPDSKKLKGSKMPFPFESEIGDRLTMGDICIYGENYAKLGTGEILHDVTKEEVQLMKEAGANVTWVDADLNKQGKCNKTSWDSFSYALIMAHSVNQHIRAVQVANELTDVESALHKPNVRDWKKLKGRDKSGELSNWVPRNLLYFNTFIEELFVHPDPMQFIDDCEAFLDDISQRRNASGNTLHFNTFFEEAPQTGDDDTFTDPDDEKLADLDKELDDE